MIQEEILTYHLIAFTAGLILDLIIGDPEGIFHPIRLIGSLIGFLDKKLYTPDSEKQYAQGVLLVLLVTGITTLTAAVIQIGAYLLHPVAGLVTETILTCYLMAAKSLKVESMKVLSQLTKGDLQSARKALSRIVGRDTEMLTEEGIVRAAVETVAENASDDTTVDFVFRRADKAMYEHKMKFKSEHGGYR